MQRNLTISYTIEEFIDVNIKDYELTEAEIKKFVDDKIKYVVPDVAENIDWGWNSEPIPKEYETNPPEEYWFPTQIGMVATNNLIVVTQKFKLSEDVWLTKGWRHPGYMTEREKEIINNLVSRVEECMHPHKGYFGRNYLPLKYIPGVEVFKIEDSDAGFIFIDNVFSAILMPIDNPINEVQKPFQFNNKNRR